MTIYVPIKRFERERERDICNSHSFVLLGVIFVEKKKCFLKIRKEKYFFIIKA
jgi:hypothetical protein